MSTEKTAGTEAVSPAVEYARGLRQLADWIEAHPEIDVPTTSIDVYGAADTKESAAHIMRALGRCDKEFQDTLFNLRRSFGPVVYRFVFTREAVCEKKVVGYRDVPEKYTSAHTEEIVEWQCVPVLADREAA